MNEILSPFSFGLFLIMLGLLAMALNQLKRLRETLTEAVKQGILPVEKNLDRLQTSLFEQIALTRAELSQSQRDQRQELTQSFAALERSLSARFTELSQTQKGELDKLALTLRDQTESNAKRLEEMRLAVENKLKELQLDNARQLEKMRATVDEKLQGTLEKRLGESFKQVSERLEQVHKGLGEMQTLATGVGDLKKVLTNVKTRGTWGEVQLGALLQQVLTVDQYDQNIALKEGSPERVEFAIRLPGQGANADLPVWLPIDAKFPLEDFQRLVEAQDRADPEAVEQASRKLEQRVKASAKDIHDKYLNPPRTTDFGLLFLPVEGLFAEVIRREGLAESIQRDFRVVLAGPTTLWSILNSLQMGFRTLAIQKRSSEVWQVLGAVKTEWAKYGEVMKKVQDKLSQASKTIDTMQVRSRAVERRLRGVEQLPHDNAREILSLPSDTLDLEDDEDPVQP